MSEALNEFIKNVFKKFGVGVIRYDKLQKILKSRGSALDLEMLLTLPNHQAPELLQNIRDSKAQLRQDLFVLSEFGFKKNGYFVEFGATNGVDLSNTHLLEKKFGWQGILAEPAKCWHNDLLKNRTAHIEKKCVWKESNETMTFKEVRNASLSTLESFSSGDYLTHKRGRSNSYSVETISLLDLLEKFKAPQKIDFLSIDTEGSEFEILSNFDFKKYEIGVITCEHNFTPMREEIYKLLTENGFKRKYENISKVDDWYVRA